ncbi:MAG: SUMF1/EgtB/PvdO family nonheme iron enzyme, partial [Bacteroidales bacterium]|nr:SUMF1/EgtB/PvdO family nonheme iron enzyme [Bacteroidales bacterium]
MKKTVIIFSLLVLAMVAVYALCGNKDSRKTVDEAETASDEILFSEDNGDDETANVVNLPSPDEVDLVYHKDRNVYELIVKGVSYEFVFVENGTLSFEHLGNEDAKPAHQVTLSDFSIGKTEVSMDLWHAVMGSLPAFYDSIYNDIKEDMKLEGPCCNWYSKNNWRMEWRQSWKTQPVECVSWDDCQKFIKKLNELTGEKFRLPTEAEWEYAARGGKRQCNDYFADESFSWDCDMYDIEDSRLAPDYYLSSNHKGDTLCNMASGVREYCSDWYGPYSSESQTNPTGPKSGRYHVTRGGCEVGEGFFYFDNCGGFNRAITRYSDDDRWSLSWYCQSPYEGHGLRLVLSSDSLDTITPIPHKKSFKVN